MAEHSITLTRTVAASPDRVFAWWTEADLLATWWWPQLAGTSYDVDARQGGGYRIESPVIGAVVGGVYAEVDPPRRLAFTWVWEQDGIAEPEEQVEVDLEPDGAGTAVTVRHRSADVLEGSSTEQGWKDVLDRLVRVAQSTSSRS
jgi:uncharacterized protein YndB with AHSA1/START domain